MAERRTRADKIRASQRLVSLDADAAPAVSMSNLMPTGPSLPSIESEHAYVRQDLKRILRITGLCLLLLAIASLLISDLPFIEALRNSLRLPSVLS
jgi:hypothetical protein